ncbi:MAG: DUF169 domain-containing protein [Deltaproteobacteria bacterium]|jgi:uncharacterized protein (DUF169 family)|nr:DUF169 domain-containing protein [Deltaproteobacteria bacterium]
MISRTAEATRLKYPPLGIYRSGEAAPGARRFARRTEYSPAGACSMTLVERAFREGTPCAFSTETVHCTGAIRGFGLAPPSFKAPGGLMGNARLVSSGNGLCEEGRAAVEELRVLGATAERLRLFSEGEGFKKSPELTVATFEALPKLQPNDGFLNLVPLPALSEPPEAVIFLADSQQISALTILAGYARPGFDHVTTPFCAACSSIAVLPLAERGRDSPKAVIGITDVHARKVMRRLVGRDYLAFSVPWEMYEEMEENVPGSFLERHVWESIA